MNLGFGLKYKNNSLTANVLSLLDVDHEVSMLGKGLMVIKLIIMVCT